MKLESGMLARDRNVDVGVTLLPIWMMIIAIIPKNTSKTLMNRIFMEIIFCCPHRKYATHTVHVRVEHCLLHRLKWTYIVRTSYTWLCGQSSYLHCNFCAHGLCVSGVFDLISEHVIYRIHIFWGEKWTEKKRLKTTTPQTEFGIFTLRAICIRDKAITG